MSGRPTQSGSRRSGRQSEPPLIPVLAVVGVGLIGGSFAAALRQVGQVGQVLGVGRDAAALARACELRLIDRSCTLAEAARADVIMLATPVGAMPELLRELLPHLGADTVLTDGGSTKQDVVDAAREALGDEVARFVPGHPVAGSELSGPEAARPDLFLGRQVVLTPLAENPPELVQRVRQAWLACGAHVTEMSAEQHDDWLASVSHLPHLLAYAYIAHLAEAPDASERMRYAGSGFRDFSRIAAASPEMWRDILLANRTLIRRELDQVREQLLRFDRLLETEKAEELEALLAQAAELRRSWRL
ncbi:MAG: prephenate dehydrogenase/arogenate dehydrogenase family protein [Pigmentiphaga sp.]|nr:prephenate dehydrogenase/arogenate dehydrogenase family protein [Pigmentiphaga sp.]